jgi:hypothetical protein
MELPFPEAAAMLARVGALEALLRARLAAPAQGGHQPVLNHPVDVQNLHSSPDADRWLTPHEAATIARVQRRVIYGWSRRMDWRGFTRRLSRKVLRVEERGFRRWLDRQGSK